MSKREVWYARFLWSYCPIHWKGWAVLVGQVALANAFVQPLAYWTDHHAPQLTPFVVLGGLSPFVLWVWWTMHQHSEPPWRKKGS